MFDGLHTRRALVPVVPLAGLASLVVLLLVPGCAPCGAKASDDTQPASTVARRSLELDDYRWRFWGASAPCPPGTRPAGVRGSDGRERWCELSDGTHHGVDRIWYPDGRLQWLAHVRRGSRSGLELEYYANGWLRRRAHWHANELVGVQTWWSQRGLATSKCRYLHGVKQHCWDPRSEPEPPPP